jgi:hypothetical protein
VWVHGTCAALKNFVLVGFFFNETQNFAFPQQKKNSSIGIAEGLHTII